jgi:hypothetical protein
MIFDFELGQKQICFRLKGHLNVSNSFSIVYFLCKF